MRTIILCGGKGIRLGNQADYIPKGMVSIAHKPILWHIMKRYSLAGHTSFVLALGKKGELIRDYFSNYLYYTNDVALNLGTGEKKYLSNNMDINWDVSLVDTGDMAMSGARIDRCKQYLGEDEDFMVTYSDSVANIDIKKLIAFHKKSKKVVTVTGAIPPYREGEFILKENGRIELYDSREKNSGLIRPYINGGFMIFNKKIFNYLNSFNECKLETQIFPQLIQDQQIAIFPHTGFWRWLDTERDYEYLNDLADKNNMYWLHE